MPLSSFKWIIALLAKSMQYLAYKMTTSVYSQDSLISGWITTDNHCVGENCIVTLSAGVYNPTGRLINEKDKASCSVRY